MGAACQFGEDRPGVVCWLGSAATSFAAVKAGSQQAKPTRVAGTRFTHRATDCSYPWQFGRATLKLPKTRALDTLHKAEL